MLWRENLRYRVQLEISEALKLKIIEDNWVQLEILMAQKEISQELCTLACASTGLHCTTFCFFTQPNTTVCCSVAIVALDQEGILVTQPNRCNTTLAYFDLLHNSTWKSTCTTELNLCTETQSRKGDQLVK